VRSGDRPIGNTAATDQSSTPPGGTSNHEDIDDTESVTAVQPTEVTPGDQTATNLDGLGDGPDGSGALGEPGDPGDAEGSTPGTGAVRGAAVGEVGAGAVAGAGEARGAAGQAGVGTRRRGSKHRATSIAAMPWLGSVLASLVQMPLQSARRRGKGNATAGGTGFARLTTLPTILVAAWLLVGLPLLAGRAFSPAPMLLITVPVAIALATGLRRVPAVWPRALPGTGGAARDSGVSAWWGLAGTVIVAAGFAAWQFWFNSESLIVLRDPGAYLQTGYWIAQHGSLPIPQSLASFGGAHSGLGFASTGFAASGTSVVPKLMSGLPLVLAGAFWVHGAAAAAAMGPILGGLAVLAFGGLTGRLVGLRWAPAGALVLALTLPEQYTSRASFSETAAQVLLFGGLSLIADALALRGQRRASAAGQGAASGDRPAGGSAGGSADGQDEAPGAELDSRPAGEQVAGPGAEPGTRVLGDLRVGAPGRPVRSGVAGSWTRWLRPLVRGRRQEPGWALMALGALALGLTAVVRFEGLLDILPAIPFIGVLVIRRSPAARPLAFGVIVGAGYGLIDAYVLARPLVDSLQPVPELIGLIAAWLAALTLAAVELMRLPGFRQGMRALRSGRLVRWLPEFAGSLTALALIALIVRPYLQTVRGPATGGPAAFVASLQRLEHLPVDPGRLYAEDTLYWVIWYIGLPTILLGGFGLVLLVRRCLRALVSWRDPSGAARIWVLPVAVICCGSAAVLWQPHTVPDQPWASRRLVPLVIPGLILFALWASAWLRARGRSRGAGRTAASLVGVCCIGAMLVPTVATSFGIDLSHSGDHGGLAPSANGLALKRTGPGEDGAVARLCSSIGPNASVVIVDRVIAEEFSQVIRGMCAVPTASMIGQPVGSAQAIVGGIIRAGRRPVLLGARPSQLDAYGGGGATQVLNLSTSQDAHTLTQPPTTLSPARYVIWMSSVGPVGTRV
jgi:hypothetical protein